MEEIKDEIIDTRTWTIYMHKNKINGKVYIGQTKQSLNERFGCDGHRYDSCPIFFNAINKYGWDNFEHIVLFDNIPTRELANKYEEYLIYLYNANDNKNYGYNSSKGGNTNSYRCIEVSKYDYDGYLIRTYKSLTEAAYENCIDIRNISNCIRGISRSAGGFQWRNGNDKKIDKYPLRYEYTVYKYDLDGKYIGEFKNLEDAAKTVGGIASRIDRCCKLEAITYMGYQWSMAKTDNIGRAIEKTKNYKPIYKYSCDGYLLGTFETSKDAALEISKNNYKKCMSNINACLNKKIKTAYGFIYSYDYHEKIKCIDVITDKNNVTRAKYECNGKVVFRYDMNGNFIESYKSCYDAARSMGLDDTCGKSIAAAADVNVRNKTAYGSVWSYVEISKDDNVFKNIKYNPVIQLDDDDNFIAKYSSVGEAAKAVGLKSASHIRQCCIGKEKTAKGYHWKYEKDYYNKM